MQRRGILGAMAAALTALFGVRSGAAQDTQQLAQWQREAEEARGRALAAFPYRRVTVAGTEALAEWERLRAEGKGWPVIVGDDEGLNAIAEQFSLDDPAVFPVPPDARFAPPPLRSPQQIIEAAAAVKLPEGLRGWMALPEGFEQEDAPEPPVGEWPEPGAFEGPGLTVASDIVTGKPFDRVHIVVLPTQDAAEAPAYLRYGNWNACPPPEVHVAILRLWQAQYGAELVGINQDTMNIRVARRPATREAALVLAREQYLYCEDIVTQGTEALGPLARILMDQKWWFFWWD